MQVKVFESDDMATGLKRVRKELGPDALILSTRTVRNGKLGLLGKPTIEITAAIDTPDLTGPDTNRPERSARGSRNGKAKERQGRATSRINTTVGDDSLSINYSSDTDSGERNEIKQLFAQAVADDGPTEMQLKEEVDELKDLVNALSEELRTRQAGTSVAVGKDLPLDEALKERLSTISPGGEEVIELLVAQGVNDITARTIADYTRAHLPQPDHADPGKVKRFVVNALEGLMQVQPPEFNRNEKQQRLALIGPTGVGKTTTLAKLAAHYLSSYSSSVALITIDTYRIAAVEQLKVYGDIMHLPVDVVISPEQLEDSLQRHSGKDLILIDTAGRSPRDSVSIGELSTFFKPELGIEKHLVLSATTRENELFSTLKNFQEVGIDRTIFTKVDECTNTGVILNVQLQNNAPLSCIANGQRVPEDLLQVTRRSVAELIMSHHQGSQHD